MTPSLAPTNSYLFELLERTVTDYDPLSEIIDEPLTITLAALEQLQAFRRAEKLEYLPGVDTTQEKARLSGVLNDLADRLIAGVESQPTKLWVMTEFEKSLRLVEHEDTEGREHFGMELGDIMDTLGIESSDGLLAAYLGGM